VTSEAGSKDVEQCHSVSSVCLIPYTNS